MSVTIGEVEVVASPSEATSPASGPSEAVVAAPDEGALLKLIEALREQALRTWSH